jgi:hypothetical protein
MDAADVLYGVSMGGDGVTKVVSRRLPREEAVAQEELGEGPRPFAGIAVDEDGEPPAERSVELPADAPRSSAEAA